MVVDDLLDVLQVLHAVVACLIPCRSNQRPNLGTSYVAVVEEPGTVRVGAITHVMGDFGDIRVGGPLREGAVKGMIWCGAQQSVTGFYVCCTILCQERHDHGRGIPGSIDLLDLDAEFTQGRGGTQDGVQIWCHIWLFVRSMVIPDTRKRSNANNTHMAQARDLLYYCWHFVFAESTFLAVKEDITWSMDPYQQILRQAEIGRGSVDPARVLDVVYCDDIRPHSNHLGHHMTGNLIEVPHVSNGEIIATCHQ